MAALQKTLGNKAVKKPKFDFKGTTEDPQLFGRTAATLEATGVAAYGGPAPMVQSPAVLKAALAIRTVEATYALASSERGAALKVLRPRTLWNKRAALRQIVRKPA